ncbi:Zn-dependent exopeptidase [Mycena indigotica]|uniref:Zn-dependent exopeptidase n=1 Tax=Mycena indigotica TaxID=2126181 RepID=A0A8H6WAV5_9AGAR|nr:Zn-dependent exopeptidase [Mycena indigotica]KAF7309556.1 Zn-dependent exopeptidase [Mycena indigotica]
MASFQQPSNGSAEGLCLRFPQVLAVHSEMTMETALNLLQRGHQIAAQTPFQWGYIDRPADGEIYLVHVSNQAPFPIDGIRYQAPESKGVVNAGANKELEVHEVKYGFVPGQDNTIGAARVRRRFRLIRGGYSQLWLVHYSHGPTARTKISVSLVSTYASHLAAIQAAHMNQPVREYPLRPVGSEGVYVLGEKAGQKVNAAGPLDRPTMPMQFNSQQMLAQQNNNMARLEQRRREHDRVARQGLPPRADEEESGDEYESSITTKALAMTRYRRNHELMAAVFTHAAFGEKYASAPPASYSIFDKSHLDTQMEKLEAEITVLMAKAEERKAMHEQRRAASRATIEPGDMSIDPSS